MFKFILFLLLTTNVFAQADYPTEILLKDEGSNQGYVQTVDCVGSGVTCTASTGNGTVTVSGGGSGTVNSGTANQVGYYATTGTAISGDSDFNFDGTNVGIGTASVLGETANNILSVYKTTGNTLVAVKSASSTANNGFFAYNDLNENSELRMTGSGVANTSIFTIPSSGRLYTTGGGGFNFINSAVAPIRFAVGGTAFTDEKMRIDSTGNIGIADTTPDAGLEVAKVGSQPLMMLSSSDSGDGDYLFMNSAGNIGLGTTTHTNRFEIYNESASVAMRIRNNSTTGISRTLYAFDTTGSGEIGVVNSGAPNTSLAQVPLSTRNFGGGSGGYILGATNAAGEIVLATGGSAFSNERMRIDSVGNVGIGTTTPSVKLDVIGSIKSSALTSGRIPYSTTGGQLTDAAGLIFDGTNVGINSAAPQDRLSVLHSSTNIASFYSSGTRGYAVIGTSAQTTGNRGELFFGNGSAASSANLWGGIAAEVMNGATNSSDVRIFTNNGSLTERFRVTSTGNVGIGGDTTPDAVLEVAKIGSVKPLMISSSTSGDGDYLTVSSAGNVGIGTTLPRAPLEIHTGSSNIAAIIRGQWNTGVQISNASTVTPQINGVDATLGASNLTLQNYNGYNVGIGTTSPAGKLDVSATGSTLSDIVLTDPSSGTDLKRWVIQYGGAVSNDFRIRAVNDAYSSGNNAMVISRSTTTPTIVSFPNGNVGIGSTAPGKLLDVAGQARVVTAGFTSEIDDGNSSTADTIDWTTGNRHKSTMTGNCTYTFTAPTNTVTALGLKLVQDGTGSRTATWPATVKWPGGTAPTLTTTAAAVDYISCYFDGTNYLCNSTLDVK